MKARLVGAVALAAALGAGHAQAQGPRPAFAITPERNDAAGFAITHSLIIGKLVKICATVQNAPPRDPEQVVNAWNARNAERLEAAHGYLFYVRAVVAGKQGNPAGEAFYKRTIEEFEQNAAGALSEIFSEQGPTAGSCAKWLATIEQRRADLDWKPQYLPVLDEILAFHRSVMSGARPKP